MWIIFTIHITITVLSWFAVYSIYSSLTRADCTNNCKKLYSEEDVDALTTSTMQGIFLVLYLVYKFFIWILIENFDISEHTEEKVNELHSYNLLTQIFVCVYGIAYLLIYRCLMTFIPMILLTISCLLVCLICFLLLVLIAISYVETLKNNKLYSRQQNEEVTRKTNRRLTTNYAEFPSLIYQDYFNLNYQKCFLCMGAFHGGEILKILPDCFHCFHFKCLEDWVQTKK